MNMLVRCGKYSQDRQDSLPKDSRIRELSTRQTRQIVSTLLATGESTQDRRDRRKSDCLAVCLAANGGVSSDDRSSETDKTDSTLLNDYEYKNALYTRARARARRGLYIERAVLLSFLSYQRRKGYCSREIATAGHKTGTRQRHETAVTQDGW